MENERLDICLSRIPLFLLLIAGAVFLLAGLDIALFHRVFPVFNIEGTKIIIYYLFLFFMIGAGGLMTVQMAWYLAMPPVILRADSIGIAFGTGMRYKLRAFGWEHTLEFKGGADFTALLVNKQSALGLQVVFKPSESIPSMLPTSIGIFYFNYTLTLNFWYMGNKDIKGIITRLEEMKKKYSH